MYTLVKRLQLKVQLIRCHWRQEHDIATRKGSFALPLSVVKISTDLFPCHRTPPVLRFPPLLGTHLTDTTVHVFWGPTQTFQSSTTQWFLLYMYEARRQVLEGVCEHTPPQKRMNEKTPGIPLETAETLRSVGLLKCCPYVSVVQRKQGNKM